MERKCPQEDFLYYAAPLKIPGGLSEIPAAPEIAWIQEQNMMRMVEESRIDYRKQYGYSKQFMAG